MVFLKGLLLGRTDVRVSNIPRRGGRLPCTYCRARSQHSTRSSFFTSVVVCALSNYGHCRFAVLQRRVLSFSLSCAQSRFRIGTVVQKFHPASVCQKMYLICIFQIGRFSLFTMVFPTVWKK